jgi:hypothetical protein
MTGRWAKPEVSRTGTEAKASRPWVSVTGGPEGRRGSGGKRQRTELASREDSVKPITRGPFGWGRNRTMDLWSLTANMALMTGAQVLAELCLLMSAMLNIKFGGQTMQNLALKIEPSQTAPELKVADPPLYMVGTLTRSLDTGDWEAFTADFSKHYTTDSRWCGGRFTVGNLEKYDGYNLVAQRSGYLDNGTGVYFYGQKAGNANEQLL